MSQSPHSSYDLAIVGGGVVGLWCAYFAQKAGLTTALFDQGRLASGASGGLLGALMPHMPTQWNQKKQFQLEGLIELEQLVAEIESSTGANCGYRRVGRVLPLTREEHVLDAQKRSEAAEDVWSHDAHRFQMCLQNEHTTSNWPALSSMPFGCTFDDLSARVNPRGLTSGLAKAIKSQVDIFENCAVKTISQNTITLKDDKAIQFGSIIVTAGLGSFELLKPFTPSLSGRPVKGQAAILNTKLPTDLPIIYQNGVYLIVHEDGSTAIGSTSERKFDDPITTDLLLDEIIQKAREICPLVADAEVGERWANLRMQPKGRDPLLGAAPDSPSIYVATGGFKISFGIAHRMAQCALAHLLNKDGPMVPESFRLENRV